MGKVIGVGGLVRVNEDEIKRRIRLHLHQRSGRWSYDDLDFTAQPRDGNVFTSDLHRDIIVSTSDIIAQRRR